MLPSPFLSTESVLSTRGWNKHRSKEVGKHDYDTVQYTSYPRAEHTWPAIQDAGGATIQHCALRNTQYADATTTMCGHLRPSHAQHTSEPTTTTPVLNRSLLKTGFQKSQVIVGGHEIRSGRALLHRYPCDRTAHPRHAKRMSPEPIRSTNPSTTYQRV